MKNFLKKRLKYIISNQRNNINISKNNIKEEMKKYTKNEKLINLVYEKANLFQPERIHLCDGSNEEYKELCDKLVNSKIMTPLSKRENSYIVQTDPKDTEKSEAKSYICSLSKEDAGPTNNWMEPEKMKTNINSFFNSSMKGRTMYIVPFLLGPYGSKLSKYGVEITDSEYVVANMRILNRIGTKVLNGMTSDINFVECLHSVGKPIHSEEDAFGWPCDTKNIVGKPFI
jgi:phosphoenolpyruvate carboxykinase (GTP)